jgi:hypothetical protein
VTVAAFQHTADYRVCNTHQTLYIGFYNITPLLCGALFKRASTTNIMTGIIDQDVNRAEIFRQPVYQFTDRGWVTDIQHQRVKQRPQFFTQGLQLWFGSCCPYYPVSMGYQ